MIKFEYLDESSSNFFYSRYLSIYTLTHHRVFWNNQDFDFNIIIWLVQKSVRLRLINLDCSFCMYPYPSHRTWSKLTISWINGKMFEPIGLKICMASHVTPWKVYDLSKFNYLARKNVEFYYSWECTNFNRKIR